MLDYWKKSSRTVRAAWIGMIFSVFLFGFAVGSKDIGFQWPIASTGPAKTKEATVAQPFEFLYIDPSRVGAYLAQLKEGSYIKQRLTEKTTNKASGEVAFEPILKAGVESEDENFVEREVTPTAASSFLELERELEENGELEEHFLHHFRNRIEITTGGKGKTDVLEDGDFVRFEALVRGPTYLDPYLAVSHAATLSALFPERTRNPSERKVVAARRETATKFRKQVGKNPRAVLSIRPHQKPGKKRGVKLLMPIHLTQLNEERSLLHSGSRLTVVGKVIRVFPVQPPAATAARSYAYVDSPTRQTWLQPLRQAPGELVCKASLACVKAIEDAGGARGPARRRSINLARRHMIRELRRETRIRDAGALIIPVAIYE